MKYNFNEFVFSNGNKYFSGVINIKICSQLMCYNFCNKFSHYCNECFKNNQKLQILNDSVNSIGYSLYAFNNKLNNNNLIFNKNEIISLYGGEKISNYEKDIRYGNYFNPFIYTFKCINNNDYNNIIIDSSLQYSLGMLLEKSKNYDEINVEIIINYVKGDYEIYIKALRNIMNNEKLIVYSDEIFDNKNICHSINIINENDIINNYLKNNKNNHNYIYIFEHLIEKGLLSDIKFEKLKKYSITKPYNSNDVLFLKEEYN